MSDGHHDKEKEFNQDMHINWQSKKGFTLIELLIVVAIIGIIAAIAIPNLLSAIQRSRQKRTMADQRSIGTGLGSYQVDYSGYPSGAIQAAFPFLDPDYMVAPPTRDGWRTVMNYSSDLGAGLSQEYTLTSYGKNNSVDGYKGPTSRYFDCDIIYKDGQFIQAPMGVQKS